MLYNPVSVTDTATYIGIPYKLRELLSVFSELPSLSLSFLGQGFQVINIVLAMLNSCKRVSTVSTRFEPIMLLKLPIML